MANYDTLPLSAELQRAIAQMGFTEMTEVQEKAIPLMMEGKEVTAKAPTGTGKTCAFGVPIVEHLSGDETGPAALILCPTRELCQQIVEELRALALFKPGIMAAMLSKKMLQSNPLRCYGVGYILLHEKKGNAQRSAAPWTAPWSWSRANSRLGFPIIL